MTANLYCWMPSLDLDPEASDFQDKLGALLEEEAPPAPSPRLVAFVEALLTRYPDLTETEDTVWAMGPLVRCIVGKFIDLPMTWSRCVEAVPFITETALKHGLHSYEPHGGSFIPAPPAAHIYFWSPSLDLDPEAPSFRDKIEALLEGPKPAPSTRLVAFVEELLTRYPDLTETEDTVWAMGPLVDCIIGDFIDMPITGPRCVEAAPFIAETSRKHGLHLYEPRRGVFVPAPVRP